MTQKTEQTTPTKYGPAVYTVTVDGLLRLRWPEGVTINRVQYSHASTYQHRNKYEDRVRIETHLSRAQGIEQPSLAALKAISEEAQRLAPELVTPEATARALLAQAERSAQDTAKLLETAWVADARARAEVEAARAELGKLLDVQNGEAA